jgi:hypothetical protein
MILFHPNNLADNEFDLTMYVPTRGRPDNAQKLESVFYKTVTLNSRLLFILSEDDPKLAEYLNWPFVDDPIIVRPTKRGFVDPLNLGYLADRRKVYSFAVGFMGDDHLPITKGWDEKFISELITMQSGLVYGNDLFQGESIPTHIAMTADIPLTLDFMTLPQLSHLYADNFWLDLGKALNRIKYLDDVVIEHRHPAAGKASHDAGYEFSGAFSLDLSDKGIYQMYLDKDLDADVRKINAMLRRKYEI